MSYKSLIVLIGAASLVSAQAAYAKKEDGVQSQEHMSQQRLLNANSPAMGQEKGQYRADERKSDRGLQHDSVGRKPKKDSKAKAKGHDK